MKKLDAAVSGRDTGIGIAEVVVLAVSKLVNAAVKDSKFRENYALNVLGIQRREDSILDNPFLMAVAAGASICLASPFSTPANVLVMSPGRYVFMDYIKLGGPLQIILGVVLVLALPFFFPFSV